MASYFLIDKPGDDVTVMKPSWNNSFMFRRTKISDILHRSLVIGQSSTLHFVSDLHGVMVHSTLLSMWPVMTSQYSNYAGISLEYLACQKDYNLFELVCGICNLTLLPQQSFAQTSNILVPGDMAELDQIRFHGGKVKLSWQWRMTFDILRSSIFPIFKVQPYTQKKILQ